LPGGKTHDLLNIIFIVFVFAIIAVYNIVISFDQDKVLVAFYIFIGSYIFSTFMLSPDLDLHKNRSKINWGILRWIWYPYSKIFKHRGISHSLIFGPITRIIYVYTMILLFQIAYFYISSRDFDDLNFFIIDEDYLNTYNILSFILGIYLPSIIHTLSDRLYTSLKRKLRR